MIEFEQVMNSPYLDIIQDIYCCDCVIDEVNCLLHKEYSIYREFVQELKKKFPKNFLFLSFAGVCVYVCSDSFKFIKEAEKIIPIFKRRCKIVHFNIDGQSVLLCIVCLIKAIVIGDILHHFRLGDKYRKNVKYIQL